MTFGKREFFEVKDMIEVLQFLFATAKDQNLYSNREGLIKELLNEYQFSNQEVQEALACFAPIINCRDDLEINPQAIRSLSSWESKYLPSQIIRQILAWERDRTINLREREILLDRLSELALDWPHELENLQEILDGLIYHLQHYKYSHLGASLNESNTFYWASNFTLH